VVAVEFGAHAGDGDEDLAGEYGGDERVGGGWSGAGSHSDHDHGAGQGEQQFGVAEQWWD
jgi:hypothetical protein